MKTAMNLVASTVCLRAFQRTDGAARQLPAPNGAVTYTAVVSE